MRRAFLAALPLVFSQPISASDLEIHIGDVVSPNFQMKKVTAKLTAQGELEARIGGLSALGKTFRDVKLKCVKFELDRSRVRCKQGMLNREIPVRFSHEFASGDTQAEITPERGEVWRLAGRYQKRDWRFKLTVSDGKLSRFADWLPQPRISSGRISGGATVAGQETAVRSLSGDFLVASLAFSDEGGLHAGEKVGGSIKFGAAHSKSKWDWKLDLLWNAGEVFWQPLYLIGKGHRLLARGEAAGNAYEISEATLALQGVGDFAFVGRARDGKITEAGIAVSDMPLESLYEVVLKPFLDKTALNDLRTAGALDFALRYAGSEIVEIDANLERVSLEDKKRRFAMFNVDAKVPWRRHAKTNAEIRLDGGEVFQVPLGKMQLPLTMHGFAFDADKLEIPVLDGKLKLNDFNAREENGAWRWSFSGGLTPVAMEGLTSALDVTKMRGTLSGEIPLVKYERSTIAVEGALLLKVFDGTIVVKDLKLFEPLGIAPTLAANVDMKRLDLDLVTRAFSFGNITGRIDVAMNDFELVNWKPVKFDFALRSSEGRYPKKISQTAVENISALGGGSAAAAIQRSVLRFFEQFGYSRIGWSCRLRDGVCEMGGVEPAKSGYVIVEGGGVPQITVLGYNRRVNWQELLARLQRVTSSKPVIQ